MSSNRQQEIRLIVELDDARVPESIRWHASESDHDKPQPCEAMLVSLWDRENRAAFRIDLWTKQMPVDDMDAFMVQTLASLADTYERATQRSELAAHMREFARLFSEEVQRETKPGDAES